MTETVPELPDSLRKFVDKSQPRDLRLLAANGMIPAPPGDLTLVLYVLTRDEDPVIAEKASASLDGIPVDLLLTVLGDKSTFPGVLDYYARHTPDDSLIENIVLNSSTPDATIAFLAENSHNQMIHDLIASSHERIVRSESIVEAISKNPSVSRSTLDSVIDYIRLSLGEVSVQENVTTDEEPVSDGLKRRYPEADYGDSFLECIEIAADLVEEEDSRGEEDEEAAEERRQNILSRISNMSVGEKIKLSIMGNREARTILVRDPNRIISKAVLKNPRLTESEVLLISQSKIVSEEILREISDNRKWMKLYQVKLSLVNNPKTPPHLSMTLLRQLRDFDVKGLAWNKNLPSALTSAARRVVDERKLKH